MKAQSADYIKLQNIYKTKARKDLAEIMDTIRSAEKRLKRSPVNENEVEAFCKGAAFVKLIHGQPIRFAGKSSENSKEYLTHWDDKAKYMCQELQMEETLLPIGIAFRAFDWATERLANSSEDVVKAGRTVHILMRDYCSELLTHVRTLAGSDLDMDAALEKLHNAVDELHRASAAELHNISALTGGIVAQEVIKVITKQYVPIDNTCVFDGITSKTAVFRL